LLLLCCTRRKNTHKILFLLVLNWRKSRVSGLCYSLFFFIEFISLTSFIFYCLDTVRIIVYTTRWAIVLFSQLFARALVRLVVATHYGTFTVVLRQIRLILPFNTCFCCRSCTWGIALGMLFFAKSCAIYSSCSFVL
jgi:hypothetical protein